MQVDSLKSQHEYIEGQLESLEAASLPKKDEVGRLKELGKTISSEEEKISQLMEGSKQLKDKVAVSFSYVCIISMLHLVISLIIRLAPVPLPEFLPLFLSLARREIQGLNPKVLSSVFGLSDFRFSLFPGSGTAEQNRKCWW